MRKSGFTLIELLIVIAVIGVLAAVILAFINPLGQLQKTRNAQRKSDLRHIANALAHYQAVNGSYPNTSGGWCGDTCSAYYCGTDWIPGLVASGELKILLKDPRTCQGNPGPQLICAGGVQNTYLYRSDGEDYKLLAHCTPEGPMSSTDPFYDSIRSTWGWTIYSPGGAGW